MRIVQVHSLATLRAAVRDLIFEYEDDPRGCGHLRFELRAWVCGAPGAEVVAGSGGIATAISSYQGGGCPGPSGGIRTLCVMRVMLPYIKILLSPLVVVL